MFIFTAKGVCSVAWISQRPPEPLTRVRIPADPFIFNKNKSIMKLIFLPGITPINQFSNYIIKFRKVSNN